MRYTLTFLIFSSWLLFGCSQTLQEDNRHLTVYTAASLTESFAEIARQFEATNPNMEVTLNVAGSQQLAHQISLGAPADVFASADLRQMDNVVKSGRVKAEDIRIFARNRLVIIYPAGNPGHLQEFTDLARPGLTLILAAAEVPAGQYALSMLDRASNQYESGNSFKDAVLNNVVSFEENVRAVLSKVRLGEADGGIVYWSDLAGERDGSLGWLEIPEEINVVANYPVAIIMDEPQTKLARSFIDTLLSPEGQNTLAQFGFEPVGATS
jgi:molybdate transport system substrate-binding protein